MSKFLLSVITKGWVFLPLAHAVYDFVDVHFLLTKKIAPAFKVNLQYCIFRTKYIHV